MIIKKSNIVDGKGLFATNPTKKGEIVFVLSGNIFDSPTRESIHIGNNKHIYDAYGIYINHSFTPNVVIQNYNVVALQDINTNDEITFNYNETEINMSNPFTINNQDVTGKTVNK